MEQTPLSDLVVDRGDRPTLPAFPNATDHHRRKGRELAMIHRYHLMQLSKVQVALEQVEQGLAGPERVSEQLQALDLTENMRSFGALCGQECKLLTFHHDAEEFSLFPQLEANGPDPVKTFVGRLREEHIVVHELLTRMERAAMALMFDTSADAFDEARAIFRQLVRAVHSHFGYEEDNLQEAIGLFTEGL